MEFNRENLASLREEDIAVWGEYADNIKYSDPEFAENIYQKILSLDEEHTTALSIYADFLHENGRFRETKLIYTRLLQLEPENSNLFFRFGAFCVETGEFDLAEKYFMRFFESDALAAERLMDKANELSEQEKFRAAEWYYRFMLRQIPDDPFIFNNYALLLADLGRFVEAEEFFKKAIQSEENNGMGACFNYANMLFMLERINEAEWYYDKCLANDPEDLPVLNNYVSLLIRKAEFHKAEMILKRILGINPADSIALQNYANLLMRDGRYNEALHCANIWMTSYPDFAPAYFQYATILVEANRLNEAVDMLRKVLELDPQHAEALALLAVSLSELGEIEESEQLFKQGLVSHSGDPILRFHYAAMLFDNERYEDAERWAKALSESDPENGEALCLLGNIMHAQGKVYAARDLFERSLKKDPSNPEVWLQAAIFYHAIRDYKESEDCFSKALQLSPNDKRILDEKIRCNDEKKS